MRYCADLPPPNGHGAQLRAARVFRGYSGGRPAPLPPNRPPAGWEPWQTPGRRRVSCSALLGSRRSSYPLLSTGYGPSSKL